MQKDCHCRGRQKELIVHVYAGREVMRTNPENCGLQSALQSTWKRVPRGRLRGSLWVSVCSCSGGPRRRLPTESPSGCSPCPMV